MNNSIVSGNSVWNLLNNYQPTLATRPNTQITNLSNPLDQNKLILNLIIALLQQLITKMSQNLAGHSTESNSQPTAQQNTTAQPVTVQPVTTQPATAQPATAQPVTAQPVTAQPVTAQPVTAQPVTTQPVTAQPVTAQPVTAQPVTTQPVTTQPVTTQPVTTQPVTTQPVTTQPVTTQPAPTQTPKQKVIDVYLLGGQSNAAGLGASRLEKALEATLGADTSHHETSVFSYAAGGTNLYSQWKADGTANKAKDGVLYQHFQTQLDAYLKNLQQKNPNAQINVAGMFWHQGESDAIEGKSKEYADNLARFIQDVRATTADPTLPFMIGRLTDTPATAQYKLGDVQRAQDEVALKTPNTVSVKMETAEPNNIHFTDKGYDTMAKLFANAYADNFVKKS